MTNKENAMLCGTEIWKAIEGYEGRYEVSNYGRVKSLNYHRTGKEKVLKPAIDSNGYWRVGLYKNSKRKFFSVHRLVAEAFLPNPQNLPEVNHKDENKANNRVENLEWCTAKYNSNYGTHIQRVIKKTTNGKLSKKVLQLDLQGNLIKEWASAHEVERKLGMYNTCINACCKGKIKTAYGFIWKYNF